MEKDARMKVHVKNKENCHQVLQKYTKLQVKGEYKSIITHKIYHSEMSREQTNTYEMY
jgi:hypothetical protein